MYEKLALYSFPYSKRAASYLDWIDVAVDFGMQNLETINGYELAQPDVEFARKMRDYADQKGIKITCTSVGINLVGEDRREKIEATKKYAEVAAILGSPYLHHTIALDHTKPDVARENYDLFYQRGLDAVREIYDYAENLGVRCVYEDQAFVFNGVKNFTRFLSDVDRNVGVVADFGNIMFVDEQVGSFIEAFGDRVINVHLKDYIHTVNPDREKTKREYLTYHGNFLEDRPLGHGSVDFDAAFAQLKKIGYDGYFALECSAYGEDEAATHRGNMAFAQKYIDTLK